MYQRVNVIDTLVLHACMFIYHASRLPWCTISIQPTFPAKTVISHAEMENRIYLSSHSGFDLRFATCRATTREFGLIVISNISTYVSKSYDQDRSTQSSAIEIQIIRARINITLQMKKIVTEGLIVEY